MGKKIIEDTISRNKKFQAECLKTAKRMKELNAPQEWIDNYLMFSKMTISEYEEHCKQVEETIAKEKTEYARTNPFQKHIVDEIYSRESKLLFDYTTYDSSVRFHMAIDPLSFMSSSDYYNDLYEAFLNHAQSLYQKRYEDEYNKCVEQEKLDSE